MAEHPHDREHVTERERTTHVTEKSSGGTSIAFVVGGLVVAVLVIFWLFGGAFDGADDAEISETNVTVEESEMVGTGSEAESEPLATEEPAVDVEVEETEAVEEQPVEETETSN